MDLNDYLYFVHVVERRGFTAAGRFLGVPKSRFSRHVQQLEERLGVRLIQRTSRQFVVTEIGEVFYRYAREAIDDVSAHLLDDDEHDELGLAGRGVGRVRARARVHARRRGRRHVGGRTTPEQA